ncbi:MAG: hypothetical protein V4484_07125 [Pseudomonadota bacterium]
MINVIKTLALNEVRLRMRRLSTLVTLLVVVILSWIMIADPAGGSALITVGDARVLYSSSALAIGSASLGTILFGLGGFYLVRGRVAEDIRSGTGSVIGATPVGNALFVFSRWLGSVAYLGALVGVFMLTIMALHAVRGDGPIEPLVYLQNYVLMLLPMMLFTASCAALFDNWAPLMGKGGDVLFFFVWCLQLGLVMPVVDGRPVGGPIPAIELLDFNGMGASMLVVTEALHSKNVSLGGGDFKASVAPVLMSPTLWSVQLTTLRAMTGLIALLPLLLSFLVFHRFSPDKVKLSSSGKRRSPLVFVNRMLRPASRLVTPLFTLAARLPGLPGQVVGDIALTLVSGPSAVLALIGLGGASMLAPHAALPAILIGAVAFWGVLISDMSTRDFAASTEDMTGSVMGGTGNRYWRQYAACVILGLMFVGVVALRLALVEPVRALALVAGVFSLSALATMFGRCSRSARLFMALFLFWVYIVLNQPKLPMLDAVGSVGVANGGSTMMWALAGALALAAGHVWNRRAA